ncbi:MAG: hypothetical protein IPK13_01795 [Deltaproteobacteria bacterium]|nr:hypothetical protein [Deltaproteobacteria bacterium]
MLFLKFLHYLGLAFAIGPLVAAELLNRLATSDSGAGGGVGGASGSDRLDEAQVALGRLANLGLVALFVSGFGLMYVAGWHLTLGKQPWLHIMMTLALLAGGFMGASNGAARRMLSEKASERAARRKKVSILRIAGVLSLVGAIASGLWRV